MYTDLLVPLDGSPVAAQAIPYVLALAGPLRARVTLLGVLAREADRAVPSETEERARTLATAYLDTVTEMLRGHGITATALIRCGNPAEIILRTAEEDMLLRPVEEHDCGLIVMATHGRSGIDRLRLGSVTQHVVRHAPIPTLVVQASEQATLTGAATITEITATLDGSENAERALPIATALADALCVPLTLLEIMPNNYVDAFGWPGMTYAATPEQDAADEGAITSYLEATARSLRQAGREVRTAWQMSAKNRAGEAMLGYLTDRPTGLAVMSSHGRGGIARWVLGSTTETVIAHPPCAVLVVRAAGADTTTTSSPSREAI
jgi:nucleotide-binding universal stress UspA family protein